MISLFGGLVYIVIVVIQAVEGIETERDTLRFLVLGDWGKGGSSGAYGSSINDDEFQSTNNLRSLGKDNSNSNKNGGNQKTYYQVPLAQAMGQYATASNPKPSFVIALGDNFYNNGVSSSTDTLWNYLWKDIYLASYPDLYIPWYPVFGNHDYGGGSSYVKAQLQRAQEHTDDDIWQFESTNYTKTFAIGDTGATLQILFIDTTTLAPSVNKCCNENG
jgi:hypothetical protein